MINSDNWNFSVPEEVEDGEDTSRTPRKGSLPPPPRSFTINTLHSNDVSKSATFNYFYSILSFFF